MKTENRIEYSEWGALAAAICRHQPKWLAEASGVPVERIYRVRSQGFVLSWPDGEAVRRALETAADPAA